MEYSVNLGIWKSVFAVPSVIVDEHIKLAGAAQLKVMLWILRHSQENFTVEDIAKALNMDSLDVKDCMQYWIQMGVIALNGNEIQPVQNKSVSEEKQTPTESEEKQPEISADKVPNEKQKKAAPVMPRPERPDHKYLAERINGDQSIAYLMDEADSIFGRTLSHNDKSSLLLIHEYYGMPIEVIIMLLQYASRIGKCNTRYIEKVAKDWCEREIVTLEQAEEQIQHLIDSREAAHKVQRIFGQSYHSPTEQEVAYAEIWLNQWKFTDDMIRRAYELCVNKIGGYQAKYINRILEVWHTEGISTVEQAEAEKELKKMKKQSEGSFKAAYDLEAYNRISVIDEE